MTFRDLHKLIQSQQNPEQSQGLQIPFLGFQIWMKNIKQTLTLPNTSVVVPTERENGKP